MSTEPGKRKFAVFDIDGTVIRWQLYHAVVNELVKAGHISKAAGESIHQARMTWKKREHEESFRAYEKALVHAYHEGLSDLPVEAFDAAIDAVFDEYKDQVYTYTRDLIKDLKSQNYLLFAVSGSQEEIVAKLAAHYGFDDAVGQLYERKDGHFSGAHTMPMHHKDIVLQELVGKHDASMQGSIAIGDSEGDMSMLKLVERPIAFNPSRGLLDEAKKQGWEVVIERKNVVYRLQKQGSTYQLA